MNFLPTYIILDAARMEDAMEQARELNPNHESLYRSRNEEEEILPVVAPFLFTYPHSKEFSEFVLSGWGSSWGIWIDTAADFKTAHKHFRKFLTVETEEGKQLYFRFYDPRVLRIFLPTCDEHQLKEFFGPVELFLAEGEDPAQAIISAYKKRTLQSSTVSKGEILPSLSKVAPAGPAKKSSWW